MKYPDQSANQAIERIKDKSPDLFARHGLDDDSFMEKNIVPALNANETKVFLYKGKIIYSDPLIAWGPRIEMNKLVARMKGMVVENREAPSLTQSINVLIVSKDHRPLMEAKHSPEAPTR